MFHTKTYKTGQFFSSAVRLLFGRKNIQETSSEVSGTLLIKKKPSAFKQKTGALLFTFLFLFAAFGPSFVAAGDVFFGYEQTQANTTGGTSETAQKLGELANFLVSVFTPIISAEAGLISFLMESGFILGKGEAASGSDVKTMKDIGEFLNYIWQVIRDLVNYGFIVVLLVIAFMTVVSAGNESLSGGLDAKKILPKFIVAVVAVNFTWFGAKVILDVANVATHIVYSIPMSLPNHDKLLEDAIKRNCSEEKLTDEKQCYLITKEVVLKGNDGKIGEYDKKRGIQACSEVDDPDTKAKCEKIAQELEGEPVFVFDAGIVELYQKRLKSWNELSSGTIPGILAFSILNVQRLPLSYGNEPDLFSITLKGIVALLVMIIVITVFTAMFFMLLERVIILWINIILSPIGVLIWVLKDTPLNVNSENDVLGFGPFLKSAFVPAFMGIPLVFGLLLIVISNEASLEFDETSTVTQVSGVGTIIDGINNLYELFFYVMALGSMWMAMKIAEKNAVFVEPIVKGISSGVSGVGKFIAKSPLYAQWIPTAPTPQNLDGRSSVADLLMPLKNLGTAWETNYHKSRGDYDKYSGLLGEAKSIIDNMDRGKAIEHIEALRRMSDNPGKIKEYIKTHLDPRGESSARAVMDGLEVKAGRQGALDEIKKLVGTTPAGSSSTGGSTTTMNINGVGTVYNVSGNETASELAGSIHSAHGGGGPLSKAEILDAIKHKGFDNPESFTDDVVQELKNRSVQVND